MKIFSTMMLVIALICLLDAHYSKDPIFVFLGILSASVGISSYLFYLMR